MVSGGAPLDAAVEERVKVLFCAPLLQVRNSGVSLFYLIF